MKRYSCDTIIMKINHLLLQTLQKTKIHPWQNHQQNKTLPTLYVYNSRETNHNETSKNEFYSTLQDDGTLFLSHTINILS